MKKFIIVIALVLSFSANIFAEFGGLIQKVGPDYYSEKVRVDFIPIENCGYSINSIEVYGYKQKVPYTKRYERRLKDVTSIGQYIEENPYLDPDRRRDYIFKKRFSQLIKIPKDGVVIINYTFNSIEYGGVAIREKIYWEKNGGRVRHIVLPKKIPSECRYDPYDRGSFRTRAGEFVNSAKHKFHSIRESDRVRSFRSKVREKTSKIRDKLGGFRERHFEGLR